MSNSVQQNKNRLVSLRAAAAVSLCGVVNKHKYLLCIVTERFCRSRDAELRLGVEEKLLGSVNTKTVQSERYLTVESVLECFQHIKEALPNSPATHPAHVYLLHKASLLACKYLIAAGKWFLALSQPHQEETNDRRRGQGRCFVKCAIFTCFELCNAADQSCAIRPAEVFSYGAGEVRHHCSIVLICWI